MELEAYYKMAQERIGQYDAHSMGYKRWAAPIVSAFIVAAYWNHSLWWDLMRLGWVMLFLLFLAENTARSVAGRLIRYCRDLEDAMAIRDNSPRARSVSEERRSHLEEADLRMAYAISLGCCRTWLEWLRTALCSFFRAGAAGPYYIAAGILALGVIIAARC